MLIVLLSCLFLIVATNLIHFEILGTLNARLASVNVPRRSKLLLVVFWVTIAHIVEIVLYGVVLYGLIAYCDVGSLKGTLEFSLRNCIYFSAETYTSLGFGDVIPSGEVRVLAGVEALNGLLLIGWSASYAYVEMGRFCNAAPPKRQA